MSLLLLASQGGTAMARRHELTDDQWKWIKDHIPGKKGDPGRTGRNNRRFLNAVFFVLRTGIQWADLPERYGNFETQKKRYYRWAKAGVWEAIYKTLLTQEENFDLAEELEELHLDSTSVKAHPNAATGRRQSDEQKQRPTKGVASDAVAAG